MRGRPGPFCSYCGTKWESELVWNTPEREERHYQIQNAIYGRSKKSEVVWVLQARSFWKEGQKKEWKCLLNLDKDGWADEGPTYEADRYTAKMMHQILVEKRKSREGDDWIKVEYRIVRRAKKTESIA
jgi:hypothetical protein